MISVRIEAQRDTSKITLEYQWEKEKKYDFYIKEIVDSTSNQGVIGCHPRNGFIANPIILHDGILVEFQRVLNKVTPFNTQKRPIKVHINRLWIGDSFDSASAQLAIDFFEEINGNYESVGVSHQFIQGGRHQRNIREGITKAIKEFSLSDKLPPKENNPRLDFNYGIDPSLKVGAYLTYNAIIRNQNRPILKSIKIEPLKEKKYLHFYKIKNGKKKLKDYAYFDGTHISISNLHLGGPNLRYVKNMTSGRYLVYVNKVVNQSGVNGAGNTGLLGAIIAESTNHISAGKKYSILDLHNGEIRRIDDDLIDEIFAENRGLHPGYKKESEYSTFIVEAIQKLNDRLSTTK